MLNSDEVFLVEEMGDSTGCMYPCGLLYNLGLGGWDPTFGCFDDVESYCWRWEEDNS